MKGGKVLAQVIHTEEKNNSYHLLTAYLEMNTLVIILFSLCWWVLTIKEAIVLWADWSEPII